MTGDFLSNRYDDDFQYEDIAGAVRESVLSTDPSSSLRELWDSYGERYESAHRVLYNIGKFFIPFSNDGKISGDHKRFSAFLTGATLAVRLVEETYIRQNIDPCDAFEAWEVGKGPRVIDESKLVDMSDAERYETQSRAIMALGHKYLDMLPDSYLRLIDQVSDEHRGLGDTANVFKAAFGYVVGEAGREAMKPGVPTGEEMEEEYRRLTADDSWLDNFVDRCYDVTPGEMVDISMELGRIQRLFDSSASSRTYLEPGAMALINNIITHEVNYDRSLKRASMPNGTKLHLENATYIIIMPEEDVDTGPQKDVDLKWIENGDTLEGEFEHMLSISVHPPGEMPVEEWLKTQETVYGPAIVIRNAARRSQGVKLVETYDGKALIISLDHPLLKARYQVAE